MRFTLAILLLSLPAWADGAVLGQPIPMSPGCASATIESDGLQISLGISTAGAADALVASSCELEVPVFVPRGMRIGIPLVQAQVETNLSADSTAQANAEILLNNHVSLRLERDFLASDNGESSLSSQGAVWTGCGEDSILHMKVSVRVLAGPDDSASSSRLGIQSGGLIWEKCRAMGAHSGLK